jgi:hypothetical protein
LTRLPRGELEQAGGEDDHTDRDRNGARHRRLLHLDPRQHDAERKGRQPEHGPDEEVRHAHESREPAEAVPYPTDGLAVRHSIGTRTRIIATIITTHMPRNARRRPATSAGRLYPRHRHRPAAGHRHPAHRRMDAHQRR